MAKDDQDSNVLSETISHIVIERVYARLAKHLNENYGAYDGFDLAGAINEETEFVLESLKGLMDEQIKAIKARIAERKGENIGNET